MNNILYIDFYPLNPEKIFFTREKLKPIGKTYNATSGESSLFGCKGKQHSAIPTDSNSSNSIQIYVMTRNRITTDRRMAKEETIGMIFLVKGQKTGFLFGNSSIFIHFSVKKMKEAKKRLSP